jgi:hypothetical protein
MGLGSEIRDPRSGIRYPGSGKNLFRIPGSKRHRIPDPQHRIALNCITKFGLDGIFVIFHIFCCNKRIKILTTVAGHGQTISDFNKEYVFIWYMVFFICSCNHNTWLKIMYQMPVLIM